MTKERKVLSIGWGRYIPRVLGSLDWIDTCWGVQLFVFPVVITIGFRWPWRRSNG